MITEIVNIGILRAYIQKRYKDFVLFYLLIISFILYILYENSYNLQLTQYI